MNNNIKTMTYRGIRGTIEPDEEFGGFVGELLNIYGDAIYSGDDMAELESKFRDMVDFYIEDELAEGRDPYNPPDQNMRNNAQPEVKPLKRAHG